MNDHNDNTPDPGPKKPIPQYPGEEENSYDWDRHDSLKEKINRLSIVHAVVAGKRHPRDVTPNVTLAEMIMPEIIIHQGKTGKFPSILVFTEMMADQAKRVLVAADNLAGKTAFRSDVTISLLEAFMNALPGEQWSFGVASEFFHIENDLEALGNEIMATAPIYTNDLIKNASIEQWLQCRHSVGSGLDRFSVLRERFNHSAGIETPIDLTQKVLAERCVELAGHIDELTHVILDHVQAKHDLIQECVWFSGSLELLLPQDGRAVTNTRTVMMDVANNTMDLAYCDLDIAEMTRNRAYHMRETGRPCFQILHN